MFERFTEKRALDIVRQTRALITSGVVLPAAGAQRPAAAGRRQPAAQATGYFDTSGLPSPASSPVRS